MALWFRLSTSWPSLLFIIRSTVDPAAESIRGLVAFQREGRWIRTTFWCRVDDSPTGGDTL